MRSGDSQLARALGELPELAPDLRFGQLLMHLEFLSEARGGAPLAEIEDEQFLAVVESHRSELAARMDGAAEVRLPAAG